MSDLASRFIISTKHKKIYLSISKHLAHNTQTHQNIARSKITQYLSDSPPSRGYVHQLFFFISFNQSLACTDPKTLTPHKTRDLLSSLDPPSLRYSTKPSTISYIDLHLALQVSHSMHKALHFLITQIPLLALSQLAQHLRTIQLLITLPSLLFIHTK
jgi:hypothetical protein